MMCLLYRGDNEEEQFSASSDEYRERQGTEDSSLVMRVIYSTVGNDSVNHLMVKLSILALLLRTRIAGIGFILTG